MYLIMGLALLLASPTFANQKDDLVKSYLADAQISTSSGDLYRSYKLYTYIRQQQPKYFFDNALEGYLSTVSELSSKAFFIEECNSLLQQKDYVDRVSYHCAKILYQYKNDSALALKYLEKVKSQRLKNQKAILHASIYLERELFDKCLSVVDTKIESDFIAAGIEDIFYLTRARCQNGRNDFTNAVVSLQNIKSSSRYYFDSLVELTWTMFKLRDVDKVRSTAKVIIATHDPKNEDINKRAATDQHVFQVKYILAYLDLVIFTGTTNSSFEPLSEEINFYKQRNFLKSSELKDFYNEILEAKSLSSLKVNSKIYNRFFYQLGQWLSASELTDINQHITNLISLNQELSRSSVNKSNFRDYYKNISHLHALYKKALADKINFYYQQSERVIGSYFLKNMIGSVDLENLRKTQGLWSVEDAAKQYNENLRNLSSKMGDIYD